MLANKIISTICGLIAFLLIPIVPVTTIVIGLCVTLTFSLLLIPISIIWSCFYFLLLGLCFVWEKYKILRPVASIIAVPFAIIGYVFVCLMPSMGENDSKIAKMLNTQSFPFNWTLLQYQQRKLHKYNPDHFRLLLKIFIREERGNSLMAHYIKTNIFSHKE